MNAVATLLYHPDYLPGALVLGYSLRKIVDANTKLVILIDQDNFSHLQLLLLQDLWDVLVDVHVLESRLHTKLALHLKRPELAKTYLKVQLWSLPYEKVLYLDADTLPLAGSGAVTDLLKLDFPENKILAAPDSGFPDIFNSGMFALRPNEDDYANLVALAASNLDVSFDGADQGLLNQYFNSDPDWVSQTLGSGSTNVSAAVVRTSNWVPVPFLYNTTPSAQYQYLPAFNHFGPPPPGGKRPGFDSIGEKRSDSDDSLGPHDEYGPALDTVLSYYSAASAFFASGKTRALVKLLHYIGPLKPWKGSNSGLFGRWWDVWYEYSQGKLIADTLHRQVYPISVRQLKIPSGSDNDQDFVESSVSHAESAVSSHAQVYQPPKEFTPADLCDPSNYQQYAAQPPNALVSWDATVEEPPSEQPNFIDFNDDLKAYANQWDGFEEDVETEVAEEVLEEKFIEAEIKEENDELAELLGPAQQSEVEHAVENFEYGFHPNQIAERVFSDSLDYTPLHYLLLKSELVSEPEPEPSQPSELAEELDGLSISDIDGDEIAEVEEPLAFDDAESDEETDQAVNTGVPKLFPWEFRDDAYKPEREF